MKTALEVAMIAAKALDDKKGLDIKLLELTDISVLADHFHNFLYAFAHKSHLL